MSKKALVKKLVEGLQKDLKRLGETLKFRPTPIRHKLKGTKVHRDKTKYTRKQKHRKGPE